MTKRYTNSHEWIHYEGDVACVGISKHAQDELGDIVYVELPEKGSTVKHGQEAAVLESTKAAADVYSPVSGKIIAVNEKLVDEPEKVNTSPENDGWLFKIQLHNPIELESLMNEEAYHKFIH